MLAITFSIDMHSRSYEPLKGPAKAGVIDPCVFLLSTSFYRAMFDAHPPLPFRSVLLRRVVQLRTNLAPFEFSVASFLKYGAKESYSNLANSSQ